MSFDAPRPSADDGSPAAARSTDERPANEVASAAGAPAGEPAATDAHSLPVTPAPFLVPRWVQAIILPLALLGVFELIRGVGTLFVVIVAACVIALMLNPIVHRLRRWLPRSGGIVVAYLMVLVVAVALLALLTEPFTTQISHFSHNLPHYTKLANSNLDSLQKWLDKHGFKVHIVSQGSTAVNSVAKKIEKSTGTILSVSRDVLGQLVSIGVDLVLILVLSIYLLFYGPQIGALVRRLMPPGDGTPGDDFPTMVQGAVSGYIQGQLAFSAVMGLSVAIVLWVFGLTGVFPSGQNYVLFFALFYALAELIPYIGPLIGPIPPMIVALITHPLGAVWLLIAFICLQQLEGHVVAPQIFRISLRINPIIVILALLIGYHLYGVSGALLALPVATVIRQTLIYLRRHLVFERWPVQDAPPLALALANSAAETASTGESSAGAQTLSTAETAEQQAGQEHPEPDDPSS